MSFFALAIINVICVRAFFTATNIQFVHVLVFWFANLGLLSRLIYLERKEKHD